MERRHVSLSARVPAVLASPVRAMRRLPQPCARVWLEGALGLLKTPSLRLVLLTDLSGVLLTQGPGINRNG